MKLLLTGGGGLIGRHVAARAAEEGDIELVVTARRRPAGLPPGAAYVAADLRAPEEAAALVRSVRPTHILHTAWETSQPTYWEDMANLDWVVSTARMAQAFAQAGGTRFVQLGSCAEYNWAGGRCAENETPDRPATRYGKAKLAAFRAIEAAAHDSFDAVEARIFWVFGPGENPARFIPYICRSHLEGAVPSLGSGRQRRDLLYADDAARALLMLLRSDGPSGIVNIAGGTPVALSAVASALAEIAGAAETGLGAKADREGDPELLVGASERLRATGWAPEWSLEKGLEATFGWWRDSAAR